MANPNPTNEKRDFSKRSPDELKEITRKGGIASGIAKRKKRTAMEDAQWVLDLISTDGEDMDPEKIKNVAEVNGMKLTIQQASFLAIGDQARNGSIQAITFLRDTSGQKPADSINMNANVSNPLADMTTAELRAMANIEEPKPKRKRGRPKKVKTDD